jgi:predicted nucleic acid-binding protein
MTILDTNVIVRHLTQDSLDLSPRARVAFEQLSTGALAVTLPEGVLVEAVQVLESKRLYHTPRADIGNQLAALIRMRGVHVPNKQLYVRALDLYATYSVLSFVDALCVAYAEREDQPTVMSFDQGFDKVPGITRQAPG